MEQAAPARWHVALLGGLRLSDATQELTRLPSRAVTALLARLALEPGRAHPREELMELLWPGVQLSVGRNRLRQALSTLKSVLEPAGMQPPQPVLLADRGNVRVVPHALACDALEFERHVRAGRAEQALALYRGELLPGFYDDWIDEERLRFAALHERLTAQLAQPLATPVSMRGPVPPSTAPSVVSVNMSAADTADASPPHLAPTQAPRPNAPAARITLPNYLTRLVGADTQGARVRELVLAQRLVTLIGPGGAGKTRLAVEVAHSLRDHADWPLPVPDPAQPLDIIAFVPLAACTTQAQACDALTGALQVAPGAGGAPSDPIDTVVAALQGRRALLVLDNFEQLAGQGEDLVAQLASQLPLLHLLVTSRRPLGLPGEHEYRVAALELPAANAGLAGAAANPAVGLFVERARAVRSDFHLHARNAPTLVALMRALEGMPLAIELAASRVRNIAPADMLARLREPGTPRLDLLARSAPRPSNDARHASMQRAIQWSWDLLDPPQARLLCALTVFADSFDSAAVLAIFDEPAAQVQLRLDELVAHSLVRSHGERVPEEVDADADATGRADADPDANESPSAWRMSLYQPIREFAAAQLAAGDASHWRARLGAWALQWAQALPATPPLALLRTELPNLLAALDGAVADGAPQQAVHLVLTLRRAFEDVELPLAGLRRATQAVDQCGEPVLRALGHATLAPMLYLAGQTDSALRHAELALECDALNAIQRARALYALARVRWRMRRRAAEVEPLLDQAHGLLDTVAQPPRAATSADREALEVQAGILSLRGFVTNAHHRDHALGEQLHSQALALWQRLGNQHAVNGGRYNLAVCAQNLSRNREVLQRIEPIIASARALADWRRLSQSLNVRGNAHSGLRHWVLACADYRECIRLAWRSMTPFDLAYGLWNLPRALAHLRQPEAACQLAAFATQFWRAKFGEIVDSDRRYLERVRRLAARQLDPQRLGAAWHEGEQLTLPQAVALALHSPTLPPNQAPAG